MPTILPRVNVPFEPPTYEVLRRFSKAQHTSLSQMVARLVKYAIETTEDLGLVQLAEQRLRTFKRDDALSTAQLLRWNKSRRGKRK